MRSSCFGSPVWSGVFVVAAHEALLYDGRDDLVAQLGGRMREALAAGQAVLAALPPDSLGALEEHLGAGAAVRWIDMAKAGGNPGRLLAGVFAPFAWRHRDPVMVGEPMWPGRGVVEQAAVMQHEALLNLAFGDESGRIICPYDTQRLSASVLADMARTHPTIDRGGRRERCGVFADPATFAAQLVTRLPDPPLDARERVVFDGSDLHTTRGFAVSHARRAGLKERRVADVEIAVHELVANTVTHTTAAGLLRAWRTESDLVFQVSDRGQITDPLTGRLPAPPTAEHGHGLPIVHEVADLVFFHGDVTGTVVRVHFTIRQ